MLKKVLRRYKNGYRSKKKKKKMANDTWTERCGCEMTCRWKIELRFIFTLSHVYYKAITRA